MQLLFESEGRDAVAESLQKTNESLVILSAFIKRVAVQWIADNLAARANVAVVARWRLQDIISGASDLSVYEFARDNGWTFAINPAMHYKVYLIDQKTLFVGSANLTQKGLHIGVDGNDEATVQITPADIDIEKLNCYVSRCCPMTDELFAEMKVAVEAAKKSKPKEANLTWPSNIQNAIRPTFQHLWVNDLLFNPPAGLTKTNPTHLAHDLLLLGLADTNDLTDNEKTLAGLRSSVIWHWLLLTIKQSNYEFVRFGEITAKLHTSLVDDPKPYRKEVKELIANLYEWIRYLDPPEVGIKKFNHTEALFLRQ